MRLGASLALVAVALLAAAARGEEPWYNFYATGLRAVEAKDWAQAEAAFEQARAANPFRSRRTRTYGTRYIVYIPDYQLGVVYFHQRRYQAALEALERAQARGQVSSGDPEWTTLTEMKTASRRQLEARSAPPPEGPAPAASPPPRGPDPLLQFGRKLLDEGRFDEARRAVQSLLEKEPDNKSAVELLTAITQQEALAREAQARRQAAASPSPRASAPVPLAPPSGPADGTSSEREAYLAYFRGDYPRALELLRNVQVRRGRAARPLFYMACSNASLALLRGRQGEHLMTAAREQFRAARNLDGRVTAEAHWISPAVLEALQAGGTR